MNINFHEWLFENGHTEYVTKEESEAKYFYNLVRGLQEPYPECYIKCKDNTKLFLKKSLHENK